MLNIFLVKKPDGLIDFNDGWFDIYADSVNFNDRIVQKVMKDIDNVEYAGDLMFFSKFKKGLAVSVSELSTGCKTAINVYSFPDKIFNLAECGNNALETIFNLRRGNGYIDYYVHPKNINNTVNLILGDKQIKINSDIQLNKVMEKVF